VLIKNNENGTYTTPLEKSHHQNEFHTTLLDNFTNSIDMLSYDYSKKKEPILDTNDNAIILLSTIEHIFKDGLIVEINSHPITYWHVLVYLEKLSGEAGAVGKYLNDKIEVNSEWPTEESKARSWIRNSLNENKFGYITQLLLSQEILDMWYDRWGFLQNGDYHTPFVKAIPQLKKIPFKLEDLDPKDKRIIPPAIKVTNVLNTKKRIKKSKMVKSKENETEQLKGEKDLKSDNFGINEGSVNTTKPPNLKPSPPIEMVTPQNTSPNIPPPLDTSQEELPPVNHRIISTELKENENKQDNKQEKKTRE